MLVLVPLLEKWLSYNPLYQHKSHPHKIDETLPWAWFTFDDNEDGYYDDLFTIETTTSLDAVGERNMRIRDDPILKLVNRNRRIHNIQRNYNTTTYEEIGSVRSQHNQEKEIIKRPSTIRINFHDRECSNKLLYVIYRGLRIAHVSVWFYSMPLFFLGAMYMYPIYL